MHIAGFLCRQNAGEGDLVTRIQVVGRIRIDGVGGIGAVGAGGEVGEAGVEGPAV
jgi:hypothetical protein